MQLFSRIREHLTKAVFNVSWRCNGCGNENFDGGYFCKKCTDELPYISTTYCSHCGRSLKNSSKYCSTCREMLIDVDISRSIFDYKPPISDLIKGLKYYNCRYLTELFGSYLYDGYKNYSIKADYITYIPMTEKAKHKRGFNQSEMLCEDLARRTGIQIFSGVSKVKETEHQARLNKTERLKNLVGVFRIKNKKAIEGKAVLIVDDVSTTGATAQTLALKLKKAGARKVMLLTVASVAPKDGY